MKISTVLKTLASHLSGGTQRVIPQTWREGCAAVFIAGKEKVIRKYVSGGALCSLPVEVRMRCDVLGEGDRIRVMRDLDLIAEYARKNPIPIDGVELAVCGVPICTQISGGGTEEYALPCALTYCKDGEE